ncbi:SAM-dependent methyltransferase [Streptomyces sp. NPDC052109]|uniref:SAM-dependent methyltransferase n=1 Tax=Streptomyces sp. NPDC052109 TaxID=3155527 RepID=UPI003440660B
MTDEQERVQPSGVWATAVGVARVGALETERENALFRDPLAQAFATAGGLGPSSPPLPGDEAARRRRLGVAFSIVIRTKFLDDLLQQASASGVRQVVLLGAGMDSRAFRMDWPEGTRLFEVGANLHDSQALEPLVMGIPPIRSRRGPRRRRPAKLHGDKGYDYDHLRKWLRARGIVPRLARRGVESSARLGRHRWAVERTMSWLSGCRRLHRRYERKPEHFIGFTAIAVMLICLRRLGVSAGR